MRGFGWWSASQQWYEARLEHAEANWFRYIAVFSLPTFVGVMLGFVAYWAVRGSAGASWTWFLAFIAGFITVSTVIGSFQLRAKRRHQPPAG
jgi:zinc transporter ZupT